VFLRQDSENREEIEGVALRTLGPDEVDLTVKVEEGVVMLAGTLDRAGQIGRLVNYIRSVVGVVDIDNQLTARSDGPVPPSTSRPALRD
jgi:osmotically-inducible protein OsmY